MSHPSIPFDHTTPSMAETAALVGLGRRGCAVVRQLQHTLDIPSRAFLIDDGPPAPRDDAGLDEEPDPVADFSTCDLMGVVIVGAEYSNPEAVRTFLRDLAKDRPALLLGIVLPPPIGEPVRLDPHLRATWDGVLDWPSDPVRPDDIPRLARAVSDWLAPILGGGLVCIDLSEVIILVSRGQPQALMIGSATVSLDRPEVAARMALADLDAQGFQLDHCAGMLVVIRVGLKFTIDQFEAIGDVFQALPLPEPFTLALSTPVDQALLKSDLIQVTVFATSLAPVAHSAG